MILLIESAQFVGSGPSAHVAKEPGLVEEFTLAGGPKQFNETDFNFFVSGRFFQLVCAGPKGFANEFCIFERDI